MFPLIETIIGFSAIMLVLSLLVKSLTSLIKNHFDFYSRNLRHEVYSLLEGTIEISREELKKKIKDDPKLRTKFPLLANEWKRLGEEYLTKGNITWILKKLDAQKVTDEVIKDLEGRLRVHVENVKYMFEKRLKNVTLAVGLALCLGLNINAFSIWQTLYTDQQLRATFATSYADKAVKMAAEESESSANKGGESSPVGSEDQSAQTENRGQERENLKQERKEFQKNLQEFLADVSFGVGHIWTKVPEKGREGRFLFLEFVGALLTGILVSIGAPYWHDLLRLLTKLRGPSGRGGEQGEKIPPVEALPGSGESG